MTRRGIDGVEVDRPLFAGVEPGQLHPAVVGRDERDGDPEVDGRRQDEPAVVVGVLADEVHPTGRLDDADTARLVGRERLELDQPFDELGRRSHGPVRRCCR